MPVEKNRPFREKLQEGISLPCEDRALRKEYAGISGLDEYGFPESFSASCIS